MNRREFLQFMGLTSTATLATSCSDEFQYHWLMAKPKTIISPVLTPEAGSIPGRSVYYASTCTECPANCGIMVEVRDGLPIKLEGNPAHPVNHGKLCMRGQASLTRLYRPDRIKTPLSRNADGTLGEIGWDEAYSRIVKGITDATQAQQAKIYLSGKVSGLTAQMIGLFCDKLNITKLPEFEPSAPTALLEAYRTVFGQAMVPLYQIEKSDLLLTIGADILETFVSPVCYSQQFATARAQAGWQWYHAEPHLSLTGLKANQRLVLQPGSELYLLAFLTRQLAKSAKQQLPAELLTLIPDITLETAADKTGIAKAMLAELLAKFDKAAHPLLIVGGVALQQPSAHEVALLAALFQWATGMTADTVDFAAAEDYSQVGSGDDWEQLRQSLSAKKVGVIFLHEANPVRYLPEFKDSLGLASLKVGLGDFVNETLQACDLILPVSNSLEELSYLAPRRNLKNLVQSLVKPFHNTRPADEILTQLLQKSVNEVPELAQITVAKEQIKELLQQGFTVTTAVPTAIVLNTAAALTALKRAQLSPSVLAKPLLLVIPSVRSLDGRSQDLPLLQEIPDPLSTVSYGNWVSVGEKFAVGLRLKDCDEVNLVAGNVTLTLPVKLQPALPDGILMVQRFGTTVALPAYLEKIVLSKTGRTVALPILSGSQHQKGRGILAGTLADHNHSAHAEHDHAHTEQHAHEAAKPAEPTPAKSLYPPHEHKDYRWAMAINLDQCSGCSACVAACYVENNVPVVGPTDHLKGREMSWLRMEPYATEENAQASVLIQPMLCQHCDNAPCESVCPVFAAYHTPEGLNAQIYNRCVGTRFCANNCPFKVRRFNWFDHPQQEPADKLFNPDVTVRTRGVMEKCTFCIQRIREAKELAKAENRKVKDGEVVPACMQTCPANAIVFGNIMDPESQIYKLVHERKTHRVLEELGVEPAVYYLPKKGEIKDA